MAIILDGTNGVSDVDGSASTPAIRGTDANTGIFFPAADTIAFAEGGAETMRINSSGNVGIGTTSPSTQLQMNSGDTTYSDQLRIRNTNYGNADIGVGSGLMAIATDMSNIAFYTSSSLGTTGSAVPSNERARITAGGDLFVGTTTGTINTTNFGAKITQEGGIFASRNENGGVVNFSFGGNAGLLRILGDGDAENTNNSYGAISDIKTKQDVVDAASQWDDIKNTRVRKFRFKNNPTGPLQIGVVAQELQEVSPGLVDEHPDYEEIEVTDEEGNVTTERQATGTVTKSVKYSILYMKAVKALQEAMERIETLEAKNDALEARIAALEGAQA